MVFFGILVNPFSYIQRKSKKFVIVANFLKNFCENLDGFWKSTSRDEEVALFLNKDVAGQLPTYK